MLGEARRAALAQLTGATAYLVSMRSATLLEHHARKLVGVVVSIKNLDARAAFQNIVHVLSVKSGHFELALDSARRHLHPVGLIDKGCALCRQSVMFVRRHSSAFYGSLLARSLILLQMSVRANVSQLR